MYRQMTRQSPLPQIYCTREEWCDLNCGRFHTRRHLQRSQVRHLVGAIGAAVVEEGSQSSATRTKEYPQLTVQIQPNPGMSTFADDSPQTLLPNGVMNFSLALPPVSPLPASPGSVSSNLSTGSVTLEDIIASARRKISGDFKEIRLPSPEFVEEDSTLWDKRAARKKLIFHESSLDIPAMEQQLLHQYEDQEESEAELVIQEEPPQFFGDEEVEDFEEVLKASKPPVDAFSNPILLRDADPLTTRKKRRNRMFPREQSMSRIQQLGSRIEGTGSSTPSGHTGEEDPGDNSSIDLSLAELSAAVAQGKSPAGSSGPSPNILQFIEEQKQKGAPVESTEL